MILVAIAEARAAGARLGPASRIAGVSARTVERWLASPDSSDGRRGPRRRPENSLAPAEEANVLSLLSAGISPKQLVPQLADEGEYVASESTMYRLLRRRGLVAGQAKRSSTQAARTTSVHEATRANQVWSWDITYLPTMISGRYHYLYLVMDVWSRRIVGWEVHDSESAEHASRLLERICRESAIDPRGLVLHSDNGTPMRGRTMVATLQWLGIIPSFSRPHVSNDNPYSEALFRTLKYTPAYPRVPFGNIDCAREWVARFVAWYNSVHLHSAIRFVTPDDRHFGSERAILEKRAAVYEGARCRHPERWTRAARNWTPVKCVVLNPEPQAA